MSSCLTYHSPADWSKSLYHHLSVSCIIAQHSIASVKASSYTIKKWSMAVQFMMVCTVTSDQFSSHLPCAQYTCISSVLSVHPFPSTASVIFWSVSVIAMIFILTVRDVPNFGSGRSGIRPFMANPAKSGSGHTFGRIWTGARLAVVK